MKRGIIGGRKEGSFLATMRREPQAPAWFTGNRDFSLWILLSSQG